MSMRRLHLFVIIISFSLSVIIYLSVFWQSQTIYNIHGVDWTIAERKDQSSASNQARIYIFFGTRPEIIKLAPVILELRQSDTFIVTTVFTGQHADIIDRYLRLFNIAVDIRFPYTLKRNQSLNMLFGKIMLQADLLHANQNDIWIIQGDTSSALAIATVAFQKQIRIAHVEAGLRTFNMYSPYPEEFNRKTISSIATYNFAPTRANAKNLLDEGIDKSRIFITGNTVIDATKYLEEKQLIKKPSCLKNETLGTLVLVTVHRRENLKVSDSLYRSISLAKCKTCTFVVPVHPNPVAGGSARRVCSIDRRFVCVSPLPYEELHWVLKNAEVVLTDSGGIQEEVTWYNTPTIILRNDTERKESIESGIAYIVEEKQLPMKINELLVHDDKQRNGAKKFPFGDGTAAKKIGNILMTTNLRLNENVIKPSISNVTFEINPHRVLVPPEQTQAQLVNKIANGLRNKQELTVAVILQVYKRKSLSEQLESVVSQSLKPKTIVIVQNGYHVNISTIVKEYRQRYKEIEFQHIASSKNLRFHGRFHIAYLQKEDYVSIWDDDMYAKREWIEYSVQYSKMHNFSLVGANSRVFHKIDLEGNKVIQIMNPVGKCDFVGHIWTLPRQYLIFYLALEPLTYHTGEDVQLSFALQRQEIWSFKPPMTGDKFAGDMKAFYYDVQASTRTNQAPRTLLFCSLLLQKFRFIKCQNCGDKDVLRRCIELNKETAKDVEEDTLEKDREENIHSWS